MSNPSQEQTEQAIEESILNTISSPSTERAQPGAVLLSPQAKSKILSPEPFKPGFGQSNTITSPGTNSSMALLSPPASRYAFEPQDTMSPLLNPQPNFGNVRPLSAQDFSYNNDAFLNNRPLSAQGFNSSNHPLNVPERPLSSMEIDSITFKNDVANLISWINTLNSNQYRTVIDNLIPTLPDDILSYTKTKIDEAQNQRYVSSPTQSSFLFQSSNQEPLTLDAVLNSGSNQQPTLSQPQPQSASQPWSPNQGPNIQRAFSPNFTSTFDRTYLNDLSNNRPRSADPYSSKIFNRNNNIQNLSGLGNDWETTNTPSKSRTSRFDLDEPNPSSQESSNSQHHQNQNQNQQQGAFDITNLAQQLTQTPIKYNDYNNSNALKLSALSTINSRAQLDSNKKRLNTPGSLPQQGQTSTGQDERGRSINNGNGFQTVAGQRFFNQHQDENYQNRNSMSVPPPQRNINYYDNVTMSPSVNRVLNKQRSQTRMNHQGFNQGDDGLSRIASLNNATKNLSLNDNHNLGGSQSEFSTPYKQIPKDQQQTPRSPAINPKQITSIKLLADVPAWLKALRLHKYTPALQSIHWKELIYLDDKELEAKGVSAMGARGKLLKAFEIVKNSYEKGEIKE
ncbi:hypothetical protein BN7_4860 [Wickerhamomyces ciferrii]|uniref:RNA-binding protein VTS1 n=1 Tax=Wickerhamomyces ciferrii (strain ATCC 14091 / BCRC 22168 / CBS 111 / JCM 3599 / NBRC 0793 / NRRL Y-1031 F-60-10) TaxID=1206466 RepID=K0KVY6_WICCF|nr:uncharacterized protein BN7_4860 [Wickerhamomyces ciferrii]CCH45278.1 hypothetical protein BN7_4860 [Wickerhamomyces ciferrii]